MLEFPPGGLPEKPLTSDGELQTSAEALSAQWEMASPNKDMNGLSVRVIRLRQRLAAILRACRKTASLQELTPEQRMR